MPECAQPLAAHEVGQSQVKLHDPAGLTALCLVMTKGDVANTLHLELTNGSGIALASGLADRFQMYSLLVSKRDVHAGLAGMGLRFDAKTGRIWLDSDEFTSASLLFMRRWELQEALGDLYGTR